MPGWFHIQFTVPGKKLPPYHEKNEQCPLHFVKDINLQPYPDGFILCSFNFHDFCFILPLFFPACCANSSRGFSWIVETVLQKLFRGYFIFLNNSLAIFKRFH